MAVPLLKCACHLLIGLPPLIQGESNILAIEKDVLAKCINLPCKVPWSKYLVLKAKRVDFAEESWQYVNARHCFAPGSPGD
ncbi:predicted protein [Sclerotinia sclerotiorum 1980 UF-70]|uniref:Uncharacterized protein n=1 Tax=Sclerotinia sclerotiorum (strain ATCC 18683 / 1980 / Ss-1) TaxID=665079 RepID=A7F275_SCLS1|nr:predicted protein [Sclerotinia sclerotiorum 1980 UF-70]EDN95817.1 predicted protein [Sclerotinia sclerotiorum 1980 UF-70]